MIRERESFFSEACSLLKDRLTIHIRGTDKEYTPFFNCKGHLLITLLLADPEEIRRINIYALSKKSLRF